MRSNLLIILVLTAMSVEHVSAEVIYLRHDGDRLPLLKNKKSAVIKSRVTMDLGAMGAVDGSKSVTVVNAASTTAAFDDSLFIIPEISNGLMDFGYLQFTALTDNDLKQCGPNNNQQCGTAFFRIYTTGQGGSGFWNAADGYGAPITGGQQGNLLSVGLGSDNAAVVQTLSIPNNKHVVNLSDFSPAPKYNIKGDFTEAGAGSYSATIVVEYGLSD
ncbi:MAG: hypothetical protein AABZ06_12130 [Bdellovibrionota bacterium]